MRAYNLLDNQAVKNMVTDDSMITVNDTINTLSNKGFSGIVNDIQFFIEKESELYNSKSCITHNMDSLIVELNSNIINKCERALLA